MRRRHDVGLGNSVLPVTANRPITAGPGRLFGANGFERLVAVVRAIGSGRTAPIGCLEPTHRAGARSAPTATHA